ncbi:hypothetical protein ES704_01485 [subsurface metagenome]|jgi:hypothetical protein
MRIEKTKKELLKDLVHTYKEIIEDSKKDLHTFIDNPNNETWAQACLSLAGDPFLLGYKDEYDTDLVSDFDYYSVHEDHLREIRDKLNVLADFFMEHYIEFVKKGLEYDKLVLKAIEDIALK